MNDSAEQTIGGPAQKDGQQPQTKLRPARLIFPVLLLLSLAAVIVVPPLASLYDQSHRTRIECTVVEAEGVKVSGPRNGGGPYHRVYITTAECGELLYETGITASNRDSVAAELEPGEKYSFEIGEVDNTFRWLMNRFDVSPEVWSFEEING
ncbi:hypothetical protein N2K95_01965 [Arthrobacter zhaoxinii]|uniref:Uncharacterized protein n=1 Tax=Arthrobacter zhaoxinii TaxID=2964616 RepID=A0ABY5YT65_9MICC|nr:hypothetical protein [Arthrobacter zhaoxinii]UWX97484.1 hypothetical protein N2K95_01965 [Arthrobacter zhaoxinii]